MRINKVFFSHSEAETEEFAAGLAEELEGSDVVILDGGMGCGKSVLARGIIHKLGYQGAVTSPTFTLMNEYPTIPAVYHFDLYRLDNEYQLLDIGFEDYVYSDGISLIEWAEKAGSMFPEKYILVKIERINENERKITVSYENSQY